MSKKIVIVNDPTGTFSQGNWFYVGHFLKTLADGFWPPSLEVQYEDDDKEFIVRGNEYVPIDAPEKAFRAQQLLEL